MQVKPRERRRGTKWDDQQLTLLFFSLNGLFVLSLSSPVFLSPVLDLEHPEEYSKAREPINALLSPPTTTNDEVEEVDEEGEAKKEEGKEEQTPPPTTKPKPVVFDIGGRRFRVDTLQNVADALVVSI